MSFVTVCHFVVAVAYAHAGLKNLNVWSIWIILLVTI